MMLEYIAVSKILRICIQVCWQICIPIVHVRLCCSLKSKLFVVTSHSHNLEIFTPTAKIRPVKFVRCTLPFSAFQIYRFKHVEFCICQLFGVGKSSMYSFYIFGQLLKSQDTHPSVSPSISEHVSPSSPEPASVPEEAEVKTKASDWAETMQSALNATPHKSSSPSEDTLACPESAKKKLMFLK